MAANRRPEILSEEQVAFFDREGFLHLKGFLDKDQIEEIKDHFLTLLPEVPASSIDPLIKEEKDEKDPLTAFPRILYAERLSEFAKGYLTHPDIMDVMADIFKEEALGAALMYYFKPPGARGQALHQDNYYLRIEPGTCVGFWMAIDPSDEENGGLVVVPNTGREDIQCPHQGDKTLFAYTDEVDLPEGTSPVPVNMEAGDVLIFNGNIIHGSYPNRSKDRFRRSLIGHYIGFSSERTGHHISELLYDRHGNVHIRGANKHSGPCGTIWNEETETVAP